jgi:hypothetical protein
MFLSKPLRKSVLDFSLQQFTHVYTFLYHHAIMMCAFYHLTVEINVSELFGGHRQGDKTKNKMGHIICRSTNRDKIVRLFSGVWRDHTQIFSRAKGH